MVVVEPRLAQLDFTSTPKEHLDRHCGLTDVFATASLAQVVPITPAIS